MKRRIRTPTVLQMEVVECGAACLAIILAHFGRWVPLEQLRIACDVTRNGSSAAAIVHAARTYGLEAKGYMYGVAKLVQQTPPFIVHWQFQHFLVVEGFGRNAVHVNDPATGPRTIDRATFDKGYTGLMLRLAPGPGFVRGGQPPRLWPAVVRRLGRSRGGLAACLLASLLLIVPGVLATAFGRFFVDDILMRGQVDWLGMLTLAMALTIVVQGAMMWLLQHLLLRIEHKLSMVGSTQLLWHLLRLPYVFFSQRLPGDLVRRLNANDEVAAAIGQDLGRTLSQLIAAAFYVSITVLFDPLVALVAIGLTGGSVMVTLLARRRLRDASTQVEMDSARVFAHTTATLRTIDTLKATGSEAMAFARWAGYHARVVNAEQRLRVHTTLVQAIPVVTSGLTTAAVLGLGAMQIAAGELTVGGVVAIQGLVMAFKPPLEDLAGFLTRLEQARAALARVDDVMNYELDADLRTESTPLAARKVKLDGRIELRSVSFGYSRTQPPFIADLDLHIEPGARIALVGGTGSGKSTIARLVVGLYRPWSGDILFDGTPADEWPLEVRRNSIAWVDQEIILFEGTLTDNLTLWDTSLPDHLITRAARDAEMHDVIGSRPGGYVGRVDEGGANLSGGEAQRLEIARALAREPSILVLDEATSALDPALEHNIDGHLRRRGCTTLIVAHRLSTIRDCDEILVLDGGRIVERGTHEALLAYGERYRELVEF